MAYYCGSCGRTVRTTCSHARARRSHLSGGSSSSTRTHDRDDSPSYVPGIDSSGNLTTNVNGVGIDLTTGDITINGIDLGI